MGIDDAQNLAGADLLRMLLTTPFDPQVLINWIDQAILYVKVGPLIDRFRQAQLSTFSELRKVLMSTDRDQQIPDLEKFAATLGLASGADLLRLTDATNFPNYNHILEYYTREPRLATSQAEKGFRFVTGLILNEDYPLAVKEGINLLAQRNDKGDPELHHAIGDASYQLARQLDGGHTQNGAEPGSAQPDNAQQYYVQARDQFTQELDSLSEIGDSDIRGYYVGRALSARSLCYEGLSNFDDAIADCTKAIALGSVGAEAYNNRAIAYLGQGDWDRAERDLNVAIDNKVTFADAYFNRANLYILRKDLDKALEDLHSAELAGYEPPLIAYGRGDAYLQVEKYSEAVEEYTKAISGGIPGTKKWQAYSRRGLASAKLNASDPATVKSAIADMSLAQQNGIGDPEMLYYLGKLLAKSGDNDHAIKVYRQLLTSIKGSGSTMETLVTVELGRLERPVVQPG
jgi:tetratricopeptide (TPR) repeat protein